LGSAYGVLNFSSQFHGINPLHSALDMISKFSATRHIPNVIFLRCAMFIAERLGAI